MSTVVRYICLLSLAGAVAFSESATPALEHEASQVLLAKKPLELKADGIVPIRFNDAARIFCREDMLDAIQRGYEQTLPDGEEPEFRVHLVSPGTYQFVNCHQQQTEIQEVERTYSQDEHVLISLYTTGSRFFGPFQSLCRVEIWPEEEHSVRYSVRVYARPESATIRFLARISPVEMFFRHKTRQLTDLVVEVCQEILKEEENEVAVGTTTSIRKGDKES